MSDEPEVEGSNPFHPTTKILYFFRMFDIFIHKEHEHMTGRAENKKYHYFYKITNKINGHFYYGVHNTNNINDGYMGSGKRLQYAYKKYGFENFTKTILRFFNTSKEAFEYEGKVVTEELVKDADCYNCLLGGVFIDTSGFVSVKDLNGNCFLVSSDDERYKNSELFGVAKGTIIVEDNEGNRLRVLSNDEHFLSGELKSPLKNRLTVKDNKGNFFMVHKDDKRIISGELKPVWYGRKHKKESIEKTKNTFREKQYQRGEKNSQYGTCWINNGIENKKIKKDDVNAFLNNGWVMGRIISAEIKKKMRDSIKNFGGSNTIWISNDNLQKSTYIKKEKLNEYLNNGWIVGRKYHSKQK